MSSGYAGQPVSSYRADGSNRQVVSGSGTTNLADLLERVLDKGIVIAGDITVSLGQVELLSIKLRLIVASIDKAQEIGIDWWRSDPSLSSQAKQMERENELLKSRLDRVEDQLRALPAPQQTNIMPQPAPQQEPQQSQQAVSHQQPQQAQPQQAQQSQPQQQAARQVPPQPAPQQPQPQQGTGS